MLRAANDQSFGGHVRNFVNCSSGETEISQNLEYIFVGPFHEDYYHILGFLWGPAFFKNYHMLVIQKVWRMGFVIAVHAFCAGGTLVPGDLASFQG